MIMNHSTSHTNQTDLKVNHKIASSTYENNYAFELLYLIHSTQKICGSDMWFNNVISNRKLVNIYFILLLSILYIHRKLKN